MRAMKDSGVEWIGEIPEAWEVRRLKYCASMYTGNSIKDEEKNLYEDPEDAYPYISSKDIDLETNSADYANGMYVKHTDKRFKIAPNGSTLMCIEGGSAGRKKVLLNEDVAFVNKLCCFVPISIFGKFLYYYLNSPDFEDVFRQHISGMIGGVSVSNLERFPVPIPTAAEQQRIAAYLDEQCGEIDKVLTKTRESIEEYKKLKQSVITEAVTKGIRPDRPMKPSGIEWIGDIPTEWEVCRIKNVIFPQQRPVCDDDEIITCFRDGEVTLRKNRREDGFTISFTEHGYQGVEVGDLVIHGMDAFAGAIGCSDSRGKTSPVVHVCKTVGNNRFFMYFLRSMAFGDILMDLSNGVRIRSSDFRNFSKLGVFGAIIPDIAEQNEIVDYLDARCAEVDHLITKKEQIITELEGYKKSLIYECVTGKREVAG